MVSKAQTESTHFVRGIITVRQVSTKQENIFLFIRSEDTDSKPNWLPSI